ncbi:hypothetical protein [Priestia megaterium]
MGKKIGYLIGYRGSLRLYHTFTFTFVFTFVFVHTYFYTYILAQELKCMLLGNKNVFALVQVHVVKAVISGAIPFNLC